MIKKISCLNTLLLILLLCLIGCEGRKTAESEKNVPSDDTTFRFTKGGAPVTVYIHLSNAETEITDFLTVTIESQFSGEILLTPPVLSERVYQPLMLVESPKESTYWSEEQQMMINRWIFKFEPLSSGEFSLKPFVVNFRLNKEKPQDLSQWPVYQIHTEEIPYAIIGLDGETLDDIRDIKGMILPGYNYIPVLVVLGFLLLTGGGYVLIRYLLNQKNGTNNSRDNQIDFYQQTLTKLEQLEQKGLINKAQFNAFHTELADILRDYVENVFGIRAKEQTTEEFISSLSNSNRFKSDQNLMLNRFLKLADLVKFATFDPGSEISTEALINVRAFVQSTGKQNEI